MPKKKATKKIIKEEPFLFEIGTEEIPASYLQAPKSEEGADSVKSSFELVFEEVFEKARVHYYGLKVLVTPRRITFSAMLYPTQNPFNETRRGPAMNKAFDSEGKPTKALEGFLKSTGKKLKDIKPEVTEKGEYATVFISHDRKKTLSLLPSLLEEIVTSLSFPKFMRWENPKGSFPRPIRWMVAFYGKKLIPFKYGELKTVPFSMGHRFLHNKKVAIKDANLEKYLTTLRKVHVILDTIVPALEETERVQLIQKQIKSKIKSTKIDFDRLDFELIETIANLVEMPEVFVGDFDKAFLKLPQEVLSASMKKHQKILACYDKKGKILNHFVAITNGKRPAQALKKIKKNFENVLLAKLRDAQFFFKEDTKTPLLDKVEGLKDVVFLGKLGSVYDKTERLIRFAETLGSSPELGLSESEKEDLVLAAKLSKADLLSQMVYEFPELQGVMGAEYTLHDKASKGVATAIFEHYLPRFSGDILPKSKVGAILAIFDKIDTFCGAFSIDLIPTGSQDPYALRRAAIGIVRILKAQRMSLSLTQLFDLGLDLYAETVTFDRKKVKKSLLSFMEDKVGFVFEEAIKGEKKKALLKAAMQSSFDDIASLEKRTSFLVSYLGKKPASLEKTAKICERTQNILKNNEDQLENQIEESLLESGIEKDLYNKWIETKPSLDQKFSESDFSGVIELYSNSFYDLLNDYFDNVMINVEDVAVRSNRKKLMKSINEIVTTNLADLSFVKF